MKLDPSKIIAASALALGVSSAFAATSLGEHASISGFGTTALTVTDNDDVEFVRYGQESGASEDPEFKVDSNLGLQLNARANDWLTGTVQVLTQQRTDDGMDTEVEWAFVGIEPVDGLRLCLGRTAMPTFAISDARNVGFANTWVRPPNEVYGLALLEALDGVDLSYYRPLGSTAIRLTALAGESEVHVYDTDVEMKNVRGVTAQWETEWATFRVGRITADSQLEDLGLAGEEEYTFTGVGVHVDRDNVVARAEFVTREADQFADLVDAEGWYVFGGYRFGTLLPYAIYATTEPDAGFVPTQLSAEQSTISAGVRWDRFGAATVKFQLDRVDTDGSAGISFTNPTASVPVADEVIVATLGIDFIF